MSDSRKGIESNSASIKRNCSKTSQSSISLLPNFANDHIHQSKRSKIFHKNIDDLPDAVLTEILYRLPCNKFVFRCKCVSKRWCTLVSILISDPYFIDRFLCLQRARKTPIIRTLINCESKEFRVKMTTKAEELLTIMKMKAEELLTTVTSKGQELLTTMTMEAEEELFEMAKTTQESLTKMKRKAKKSLIRMSFWSPKPLTPLFKRLMMNCHSLEKEPLVVATYNDLVLCCPSRYEQRDYYICNPYTIQWVLLPQPPQVYERVAVGFICDLDNVHQRDKSSSSSTSTTSTFNTNAGYRCKVVRIPIIEHQLPSFNFKVEIFSSEAGEWRESIVSFTQEIDFRRINTKISYPYNGMLYWGTNDNLIVIGFDPFMINSTSCNGDDILDHYKGRIIEFGDAPNYVEISSDIECVGVCGGCLRFIGNFDLVSYTLPVWELREEQDEIVGDKSGKICLRCTRYSLDREMFYDIRLICEWRVFDPNDEDILYLCSNHGNVFKCNILTREWSKMPHMWNATGSFLFPLITRPWWPTPVPRLPQHQRPSGLEDKMSRGRSLGYSK